MAGLLQDVRFALRQLRKSLGFTVTAVLMLALAICACSTVFSWIDGTMLHPIPKARNTNELVSIMRGQWNTSPSPPLSYLDYRDLRDRNHKFSGMLAYHHDWITLTVMVIIALVGAVVYAVAQPTKEIAQHVTEPGTTSGLPGQREAHHDTPTHHAD